MIRMKTPQLDEFIDEMLEFYRASKIDPVTVDKVMKEYRTVIPKYLAATPELIARKILYAYEHDEIFR